MALLSVWLLSAMALRVFSAETLSGDDVMQKALARGQYRAAAVGRPAYTYTKVLVAEELDTAGKVKKREEKVYAVRFQAGSTSMKLLEVDGRPLSGVELRKQTEDEAKSDRSLGPSKSGNGDRRENLLTSDLVARYVFTLAGSSSINGRTAIELSFKPKTPAAPPHHFLDRLLGRVSGTIWIDAEDFEIARAEIHLDSPVDLVGGVLGSLKAMGYTLLRTRLPDGQWFNASSKANFEGRKFLLSTSVRTSSNYSNFCPVTLR
jgi:hypothetical protein